MMLHLYLSPMSCLYNFFHLFTIADDCHFSSIHFGLRYLGDCHSVIILFKFKFHHVFSFLDHKRCYGKITIISNILIFFMLIWSNTPYNFHFWTYQNTALFTLMILSRQKSLLFGNCTQMYIVVVFVER